MFFLFNNECTFEYKTFKAFCEFLGAWRCQVTLSPKIWIPPKSFCFSFASATRRLYSTRSSVAMSCVEIILFLICILPFARSGCLATGGSYVATSWQILWCTDASLLIAVVVFAPASRNTLPPLLRVIRICLSLWLMLKTVLLCWRFWFYVGVPLWQFSVNWRGWNGCWRHSSCHIHVLSGCMLDVELR